MNFGDFREFWASYIALGFVIGVGWRLSAGAAEAVYVAYDWLRDRAAEARDWLRDGLEQGR